MLLPIRSKNPPESLPLVTCLLIAINTIVYFATSNHGTSIREDVVQKWGLKGSNFDFPHMISSMFLHGSPLHLIGNMWFLYVFGFAVEGRLRSIKFLIVYLLAGLAGDGLHQVLVGHLNPTIPSIGASGAIMGIVGAAMYMFPHGKITMVYGFSFRWGTTDWPLYGVALYYLGFDLFWALLSVRDGVGHLAHLGGALGGLIACILCFPKRDSEMVSEARATLADTKDLSTLSRMELAELHRTNPKDTTIIVNWAYRSLREPGGIRDDCRDVFLSNLPRLLVEQDVVHIAPPLALIAQDPQKVRPAVLLDVAARLERVPDPASANKFYEMVQNHPQSTQDDLQASAYRIALIAESSFQDFRRAWAWYQFVVEKWPMGHFAPQAKARLEVLARMASKQS